MNLLKKIFSFLIREGGLPESAVTDDREYEYDYLRSQAVSDSVSVNEYIELGTSIQKKLIGDMKNEKLKMLKLKSN